MATANTKPATAPKAPKAAKAPKPAPKAAKAPKPAFAPKAAKAPRKTNDANLKPAAAPGAFKRIEALVEAQARYSRDKERKTAGGNPSVDNGDALAEALRGADLDAVYAQAAKVLGVPVADLRTKYAGLNPGMQRMNLGNRMRAAARKSAKAA